MGTGLPPLMLIAVEFFPPAPVEVPPRLSEAPAEPPLFGAAEGLPPTGQAVCLREKWQRARLDFPAAELRERRGRALRKAR